MGTVIYNTNHIHINFLRNSVDHLFFGEISYFAINYINFNRNIWTLTLFAGVVKKLEKLDKNCDYSVCNLGLTGIHRRYSDYSDVMSQSIYYYNLQ